VLKTTSDVSPALLTWYGVRKSEGSLGVLIVNKQDKDKEAVIDLSFVPSSAGGQFISRNEYEAESGPKRLPVRIERSKLRLTLRASSITTLDIK
jgi:hypothetical protein